MTVYYTQARAEPLLKVHPVVAPDAIFANGTCRLQQVVCCLHFVRPLWCSQSQPWSLRRRQPSGWSPEASEAIHCLKPRAGMNFMIGNLHNVHASTL